MFRTDPELLRGVFVLFCLCLVLSCSVGAPSATAVDDCRRTFCNGRRRSATVVDDGRRSATTVDDRCASSTAVVDGRCRAERVSRLRNNECCSVVRCRDCREDAGIRSGLDPQSAVVSDERRRAVPFWIWESSVRLPGDIENTRDGCGESTLFSQAARASVAAFFPCPHPVRAGP